jgi:hypothetical protein
MLPYLNECALLGVLLREPFEHGAGNLTWGVGFLVADVPESSQNFRA